MLLGQQNWNLFEIEKFLKAEFNNDIFQVKPINGGERSKAFSFMSGGAKYIFRTNKNDIGFKKDRYAFDHFSEFVPIPETIKMGQFQDRFYAISKNCHGKPLEDGKEELPAVLVESILTTLDKIHSIPLSEQTKYGVADTQGKAEYASWEQWVLKENTPVTKNDGSYYSWNEVKKIDFVDKKIINQLSAEIKKLICFMPKEKSLIHGDFAVGNIMIDHNLVTGVIDWNEYGYGDFLFDVAWLDFWIKKTNFTSAYRVHSQKNNRNIPDYEKRIRCHQLFIGLNTLGIYAAIGWTEGYFSVLERIKDIKF